MVDAPSDVQPSVADQLRNAKELIQSRGWIQGGLASSEGYCLVGAINEVSPSPWRLDGDSLVMEQGAMRARCLQAVARAIRHWWSLTGPPGEAQDRITLWNDADNRTPRHVFALLDRAIELEERRHG